MAALSDRRKLPTRRHLLALLAAAPAAALLARPAAAQSLDQLRASGAVAERFDGLLAVRAAAPSTGLLNTVEKINAERRTIYARRAKEQGVPADQVGRVYAQQIIQQAPPGTWFLNEQGAYRQK